MSWKVGAFLAIALVLVSVSPAAAVEVPGKIESVNLYRGQALVTRLVTLKADAGPVQLVVTGLPERAQSDSLYAEVGEGAQVRAVRFRTRVVGEAPREEVRKLDEQIEALQKDIRKNKELQKAVASRTRYLDKLEDFVAPTAKTELTKGVLDAGTLRTLTLFMFDERTKQMEAGFDLQEKARELEKQLQLHREKRAELTRDESRRVREAVIFLDVAEPGDRAVRLSYLVSHASWAPAYNLRAGGEMKAVAVEYNAVIRQMSGEDWSNVTLTLSTASPTMVADAPILGPLLVKLTPRRKKAVGRDLDEFIRGNIRLGSLEEQRRKSLTRQGQINANWEMNVALQDVQLKEMRNPPESVNRALEEVRRRRGSALSVNYRLAGRASLASRSDQQIVRIANLSLPATFSHVAMPLLTENVHRQAEITNDGQIALLEGQGDVYLNGDFVGQGTIPMVASGQRFRVGFGIDPQLRTRREFVSRNERTQGGNREVAFEYRLVLHNYKDQPIPVRAFDRIPHTQDEIRVTLGELKDPLSTDKEYLRVLRPSGILRWDLEVPAHAAGATARLIEYSYKLEFDRNTEITTVTGPEPEAAARDQFQRQMEAH